MNWADKMSGADSEASPLIGDYQPLDGVHDEMVDKTGALRPAWRQFIQALGAAGTDDLAIRAARADRYLNDAGVYYRFYDKAGAHEREWPLAHLPLLIGESEWQGIAEGLIQRADLLEQILTDIYGRGRLVEQRLLPPGLIAASTEYLRPLVGQAPPGGHFLHFCAFELGRGPDGRWWVLSDRTQAPSGIGFALENRVATVNAFADIHRQMHVHRLAGFHRRFRDALAEMATTDRDGQKGLVAILTPGQFNETYFEQAYIARYLGLSLLEGNDLSVTDGRLMVRTVSGLQPVSVLWRRLDAAFADPLELDHSSAIGTPGLVEAVRNRSVHIVNALGSGVLEMRAALAFLPRICEALTGQELKLPSIATWWCGQDAERTHVLENFEQMMIGPARSSRLPFEDQENTVLGASLDSEAAERWKQKLLSKGHNFVGQESVTLSTVPVLAGNHLEPRPMTLRAYLARTPDGWIVMNGGFARIGLTLDTSAISMQRGGQAADVWIVSDKPVEADTLMPQDTGNFIRRLPGALPSQAAENLIWLGRYSERAENIARLVRAYHVRLAESADAETPLLQLMRSHLATLGINTDEPVPALLQDSIERALTSAGNVRSRFSPDGWLALRDLSKTIGELAPKVVAGDDATRAMTVILRKISGFSGLVHENMYRFTGWTFLELGRRFERAVHMARTISVLSNPEAPEGAWDMLLEIGDSVMTHRRHYQSNFSRLTILDILALDPFNPRSLMFQLDRLKEEINSLPGISDSQQRLPAQILQLHTRLAVADPASIDASLIAACEEDISTLYDSLAKAYF